MLDLLLKLGGSAIQGISDLITTGRLMDFAIQHPASAGLLISGMIFAGVIFNFGFLKKVPDASTWTGKLLMVTACFGFIFSLSWLGIAAAEADLKKAVAKPPAHAEQRQSGPIVVPQEQRAQDWKRSESGG